MLRTLRMKTAVLGQNIRYLLNDVAYVVGMGDSITAGTGASDAAHRWINILAASIDAASGGTATLKNDGVAGGETSHMVVKTYDYAHERRGVVAILAGLNDMRINRNILAFEDNYRALLEFYKPRADLIICGSLTHVADYSAGAPYNLGSDALNHMFNFSIQSIASEYGTIFADVHGAMNEDDALISADGIHPNDAGHAAIAAAFWSAMAHYFTAAAYINHPRYWIPKVSIADPRCGTILTNGWSGYQATVSRVTTPVYADGISSFKSVVNISPGALYTKPSTAGERPIVFSSTQYTIEAWVRADDTTAAVTCFIRTNEYKSDKSFIVGTTKSGSNIAVTNAGWTLVTNTIITHADCAGLEVNVVAAGVGSIIYVGKVRAYATVSRQIA